MTDLAQEIQATRLEAALSPKVSLAFHQNAIPILRELEIVNDSEQQLDNLELVLSSEPQVFKPRSWRVARVGARQRFNVSDLDVALDGGLLARLTESERSQATFSLRHEGGEIARLEKTVEILARNQWGGIGHSPDLVAAFVQPNDPAVDRVLKKAAQILRQHGKDSALNGYTSGSRQRAWELASAIWAAIAALGLDYALPPASFEREGQKIRSPSQVVESGLATCLDLTLFAAACLEQCGLNPIVVFTTGHAFAGVWLAQEDFTSTVVDDITALRKRIKLKELVAFETTLLTQRPAPAFGRACERGAQQLAESEEEKFELAVDIRRTRLQRIKPLASTEAQAVKDAQEPLTSEENSAFDDAPKDFPEDTIKHGEEVEKPETRLERWQRKLLDLSLRNALLNFRASKRAIPLDAPEPGRIEDLLASGSKLKILSRPDVMEGSDPRSRAIYEARHGEDVRRAHALEALARNELFVGLPPQELEHRLVELYRSARASLQEGGSNTLFLALGFLAWRRDEKDDRRYRAPLLLIPVALERKSVRSGFRLTLHDDEPRFNPTLLEMLRQDFALSIPAVAGDLPKDDRGIDVAAVWRAVAEAVKEIKGWEVTEDVVLSTFSFSKYLMWKDLVDRTDQLKQNPVVRHLIETPREAYRNSIEFPRPRELDATHDPAKTFCPLPADSSQLAAIVAGARGKDFVLVGPPGTGKSQTIANLIAQCLAEGKTVLFVSEKAAALDVVYRRLRDVGLGEFCLELHSNKARKLDVLEQLRRAWEAKGEASAEEWARESEKLKQIRASLNRFVEHLHRRHRNGVTAFQAVGRVVAGHNVPECSLSWPSVDAHDEVSLAHLRDIVERLRVNAVEVGSLFGGPMSAIATAEWAPTLQTNLIAAARTTAARCDELGRRAEPLLEALSLAGLVKVDPRTAGGLADLASALPAAANRDWRFVLRPDANSVIERLKNGLDRLQQRRELIGQLSLRYRPEAVAVLPVAELSATWSHAGSTWWPRSVLLRRKVQRTLAVASETGSRAKPSCAEDLALLARVKVLDAELETYADLRVITSGLWNGLDTREDELGQAIQFQRTLIAGLGTLAPSAETLVAVRSAVERLLGEANSLLAPSASIGAAASSYVEAWREFSGSVSTLVTFADTSAEELLRALGTSIASLAAACRAIAAEEPRLRAWCAWRNARGDAMAAGLGPLVQALETGAISPERVREVFEVNYHRWWINAVVDSDEVLRTFVSAEHERRIEEFRALDDRFVSLTKAYIRARLCSDLPDESEVSRGSEWGILRRELEKKRRHMALRQLIASLPSALTRLTPCVLMSPLSIAQYLPADTAQFDVVVFDEASQIPVWDAVGALARGKQAIIVGDPKQLPPTSFFERAEDDDDDVEIEADLESILDESLGANLPTVSLSWHYRSRHESLIAFSNHRYYGGRLVTFPSPVTEDRAVRLHYVADGLYEKGGARINKPEAVAIVQNIVARMKDPAFVEAGLTIGVVTFNSEQQRLIEDLFDEERRRDPSIEPFFAEDRVEPLFVKNLESVQGDERDIMYFSITYGPDRTGHISMNFGPMNRDGGERRLNVAITRARYELHVFSSLRPDQIDLSRTQAIGVRDLKHFLELADRVPRALAEAVHGSVGDYDSPFEKAVATALAERGWVVHPQIGVSAFRIDLGVVDPRSPGRFLAGIECDGATYHRAATARDRDKLREQVLRGLGWEILRIWSTDWWTDRKGALDKLDQKLRALLERDTPRTPGSESCAPGLARSALAEAVSADDEGVSEGEEPQESAARTDHQHVAADDKGVSQPLLYARRVMPESTANASFGLYREAAPENAVEAVDPESFFESRYDATLIAMIRYVIKEEGPVRDDVLVRRIARAHGFARAGARIRGRILELAQSQATKTRETVGDFFWSPDIQPGASLVYRRPQAGQFRAADETALPELRALARVIGSQGLDGDDAIEAMARELGLQRLRAATRTRLEEAWRTRGARD